MIIFFFYIFIIGLSCCTTKRTSVQKATHVVCSDADYATILDFESFEDILHSDIFFFKYFYSLIVEDIHKKTMVQILAFDIEKPVFLPVFNDNDLMLLSFSQSLWHADLFVPDKFYPSLMMSHYNTIHIYDL